MSGDYYGVYDCTARNRRHAAELEAKQAEKERAKAEQRRAQADRRRVIDAALEAAMRPAEQGNVPAMRKVVDLLLEKHAIKVEWHSPKPFRSRGTAWGRAADRNAAVRLPHIRSSVEFAIALHEIGHTLSEPCQGAGHLRDGGCIRCEHLAWQTAMEIAPFTRRMHEELAACLSTYRRVTRAAPGEMAKLDRISGNLMWAEGVQRRKQAQLDDEARKRFAKYEERLRAARRAL